MTVLAKLQSAGESYARKIAIGLQCLLNSSKVARLEQRNGLGASVGKLSQGSSGLECFLDSSPQIQSHLLCCCTLNSLRALMTSALRSSACIRPIKHGHFPLRLPYKVYPCQPWAFSAVDSIDSLSIAKWRPMARTQLRRDGHSEVASKKLEYPNEPPVRVKGALQLVPEILHSCVALHKNMLWCLRPSR